MTTAAEPKPIDPRAYLSHPDALYEVVDGQVVELPEMGVYAAVVAMQLYDALAAFLRDHHLGRVAIETVFLIDPARDLRRRPDVAFISFGRWAADRPIPEEGDWEVVPDLAVEVISPGDLDRNVMAKLREYFRLGVRRVWVVRPIDRQVYAYTSPTQVTILDEAGELTDADLLPGFRLPLALAFRRTVA